MAEGLYGVWAASLTPLDARLDIDRDALAQHVTWLLNRGCHGVAVFGSTGEANSFSAGERTDAVEALADAGVPMARVVVGAGACSVTEAAALAGQATRLGCAGVLMTPPFYYKAAQENGVRDFFREVILRVADPELRLVLYHFPRLVGIGFSEELVARMRAEWPTTVAAIKDSSGDVERMGRIARTNPGLAVLSGTERLLLPVLDVRGAGCLTAAANLTSVLAREVFQTRDRDLQARLTEARMCLESTGFVPGLKQLMADHSGDPSWLRIRPPLGQLTESEAEGLRAAVEAFGPLPNLAN